jgi:hypothetical protein
MASLFHRISVAMAQAIKEFGAFVFSAFRKWRFSLQFDDSFLQILTFHVTALFPVVTPQKCGHRTFMKVLRP